MVKQEKKKNKEQGNQIKRDFSFYYYSIVGDCKGSLTLKQRMGLWV